MAVTWGTEWGTEWVWPSADWSLLWWGWNVQAYSLHHVRSEQNSWHTYNRGRQTKQGQEESVGAKKKSEILEEIKTQKSKTPKIRRKVGKLMNLWEWSKRKDSADDYSTCCTLNSERTALSASCLDCYIAFQPVFHISYHYVTKTSL